MNLQNIVAKVQDLSDLELAVLLCLIGKKHCLFESDDEFIDDLAEELALIASDVFKLSFAVLSWEQQQSIEEFGDAVLEHRSEGSPDDDDYSDRVESTRVGYESRLGGVQMRAASSSDRLGNGQMDNRHIVNVIIAKHFNLAPQEVQIQALELIRRKRLFSHTTVHIRPGVSLFLPLISTKSKNIRLNQHLNDRIFISHYHDPDDGFPNLEAIDNAAYVSDDQDSISSVVRKSKSKGPVHSKLDRHIDKEMVDKLREQSSAVRMSPEVRRYMQDIIVFLRLERGVSGGVSPHATVLFQDLAKCLAPLHGLNYVSPSLVALAARKIYPHRIVISSPEKERSMQYGSDLDAVRELLDGVTPETIVEAVLNTVECPL